MGRKKFIAIIMMLCILLINLSVHDVEAAGHVHTADCNSVCGGTAVNVVWTENTSGSGVHSAVIEFTCSKCGSFLGYYYKSNSRTDAYTGNMYIQPFLYSGTTTAYLSGYVATSGGTSGGNDDPNKVCADPNIQAIDRAVSAHERIARNTICPRLGQVDYDYKVNIGSSTAIATAIYNWRGQSGCKVATGGTECNIVVTGIVPLTKVLREYGSNPAYTGTVAFLDGHTEAKALNVNANVNQVGEQLATVSVSGVKFMTTLSALQTVYADTNVIVYRTCPTCGSRYISGSCMVCRCNTIQSRTSSVSRYAARLSAMRSSNIVTKSNLVTLQNNNLY